MIFLRPDYLLFMMIPLTVLFYFIVTGKSQVQTIFDKKIQEIINDYLTVEQAAEVTRRLDEEVGQKTDNDSLKVSLEMLRKLYEGESGKSKSQQTIVVNGDKMNDCAGLHHDD